jgi:hypothetical protein
MKVKSIQIALLAVATSCLGGCMALADSSIVRQKLQMVSAGYTGCVPEENELSNMAPKFDGSGTWNATCKGKTYLCSTIATSNQDQSYHCAPVAE